MIDLATWGSAIGVFAAGAIAGYRKFNTYFGKKGKDELPLRDLIVAQFDSVHHRLDSLTERVIKLENGKVKTDSGSNGRVVDVDDGCGRIATIGKGEGRASSPGFES